MIRHKANIWRAIFMKQIESADIWSKRLACCPEAVALHVPSTNCPWRYLRALQAARVVEVFALHMQYPAPMKTATLPPIRVAPDFRQELEGVLEDGETLSQFVEGAVRSVLERRKQQAEFVRRGIAAIQETQYTGLGVPPDHVMTRLEARLNAARQTQARRGE